MGIGGPAAAFDGGASALCDASIAIDVVGDVLRLFVGDRLMAIRKRVLSYRNG